MKYNELIRMLEQFCLVESYSAEYGTKGQEALMIQAILEEMKGHVDETYLMTPDGKIKKRIPNNKRGNLHLIKYGANGPKSEKIMFAVHTDKFPNACFQMDSRYVLLDHEDRALAIALADGSLSRAAYLLGASDAGPAVSVIDAKLDDAFGLATGLAAMKNYDGPYTIEFVATYGHETENFAGARMLTNSFGIDGTHPHAGKYVKGNRKDKDLVRQIIVFDTSGAVGQAEFGKGPAIYRSAQRLFQRGIIDYAEHAADAEGIPYQSFHPYGAINDASVLCLTGIPTIAIEVLVQNLHGPSEQCLVSDLERTYDLVEAVLSHQGEFDRKAEGYEDLGGRIIPPYEPFKA